MEGIGLQNINNYLIEGSYYVKLDGIYIEKSIDEIIEN